MMVASRLGQANDARHSDIAMRSRAGSTRLVHRRAGRGRRERSWETESNKEWMNMVRGPPAPPRAAKKIRPRRAIGKGLVERAGRHFVAPVEGARRHFVLGMEDTVGNLIAAVVDRSEQGLAVEPQGVEPQRIQHRSKARQSGGALPGQRAQRAPSESVRGRDANRRNALVAEVDTQPPSFVNATVELLFKQTQAQVDRQAVEEPREKQATEG